MDNLVSILKIPVLNIDVKNNILRLVQNWSIAFEGKPTLSYPGQVYKTLQSEGMHPHWDPLPASDYNCAVGFRFPPKDLALANSAMVDTQTAPEWIDSDVCLRCRTAFSFTNRKHHCRNCGQVFDQQCSAKSLPLPHFGITQEVRVCDSCYPKLVKKGERR
jgi:growth factor-regulated tyrosine kinase substrate